MLKRVLPALALILIASGFAYAQTDPCTTLSFSGNIIIPLRDHPEYFDVFLLSRMGEQEIAHTHTDITNRFFFEDLEQGQFDFVVRLEGFKELRERITIEQPRAPVVGSCTIREMYWLTPVDTLIIDERLRAYPKEAIDEYVLAIRADANKKFEEVVKHLEIVVKLAADWFDAHCELGAAYEEVHRSSDAEREYRIALDLKPDSFRALMSLGRLFVAEADEKIQDPAVPRDSVKPILSQAHVLLTAAALRDPMSAMASYMLGAVDFRLGSYKAAEVELKRALELDGTIFPARITLINVYVDQSMWDDALDHIDAFLFENPTSPFRQQVLATRTSVVTRLSQTPIR